MSYLDRIQKKYSDTPLRDTDTTAKSPDTDPYDSNGSTPEGGWEDFGISLGELEIEAGEDWARVSQTPGLLKAFARAVSIRRVRERGELPAHYTKPAICGRCGPVWLWEGAPYFIHGCPWCFVKLLEIPRPPEPEELHV